MTLGKSLDERAGSLAADSRHTAELFLAGNDHLLDAAEAGKQRSGSVRGDSGHRSEHRLGCLSKVGRLRPRRVQWLVRRCLDALATNGESMEPASRVSLVIASEQRDSEVDHRETDATNRVRMEGAAVDVKICLGSLAVPRRGTA